MRIKRRLLACALLSVALLGCDSKQEKHQKYIDRGNKLFQVGDYVHARIEYKNAARINPSDAEGLYKLGLVDEAEGDIRNAFGNFMGAELQDAHYRPALIRLAQYFLAANQYEECRKRINTILQDSPDNADGHALMAALYLRQKDFEATEKEARFSLMKEPNNITAFTVLTGLYVAQQNQEKAAETVEEAIKLNPKNIPLLLLKAMVFERTSNMDKIVEAYRAIFNIQPTEIRFRDDLSQVYLQNNKPDQAEQVLREGVASLPNDWDMKKRLVSFLNQNRGMDAAEQEIKKYMTQYPENTDLVFWLADLYIANKTVDRALSLLEQLVQKNKIEPDQKGSLNARTSLARIHFARGEKEVAEKLTDAVLKASPNNREALFVRAQMLFDQADYQEAISVLRTLIRDNPKATEAMALLGEALLTQGRLDLAIDTFNQLADADLTNLPARVRLAQMYSLRGDVQKALQLLAVVTKVDPSYPVGWESTARILITNKDWDKADAAVKKLEVLPGQDKAALFLRAQIEDGRGQQNEALSDYEKVIAPDPSAAIAGHALKAYVSAAAKGEKLQRAIDFLKGLNSEDQTVLMQLGNCAFGLQDKAAAAAYYDKALATGKADIDSYLARAALYAEAKQYDAALGLLNHADDRSRRDIRLLMMKADLLMGQGKNEEAVAVYADILQRNPDMDLAANNMADLIATHMFNDPSQLNKARLAAERFIRSTNPYFLDTLGWVYFRLGETQQAQTILERIIATDQKLPPQVYYHYGAVLVKQGRGDIAKVQLQRALEVGGGFPGEDDARNLLKGL